MEKPPEIKRITVKEGEHETDIFIPQSEDRGYNEYLAEAETEKTSNELRKKPPKPEQKVSDKEMGELLRERAEWKHYTPEVTPGDVKAYIETHDMLGPDCPGSGVECVPPRIPEKADSRFGDQRRFRPDQLRCPECGEDPMHPVGWRYPAHKRMLP